MRNYVIINGVNSLTIQGLAIKTLPPITKPIQRNLREEIDGRDGDIVTALGYGAYDKTIEIGLFGTFDIDEVIAYFNQKGTITFSNEADKVYYFEALDQVDYAELLKFRTASINFHCQPFKYPLNETPLEEEYEYVEGEGTELTLNDTANAIFNKFDLKGNTSQASTPTPDTPIPVNVVSGDNEINICGKNLFNKNTITPRSYLQNDGTLLTNTAIEYNTSDFISIQPNTAYYKTLTLSPRTKYYDSNKQPLNTTTYQDISIGGNAGTFTTPNNAYYLRFTFNTNSSTGVDINEVMIHKGSTATTYEPYIGNTYPIYLGVENLLETKIATETKNGITITHNEDGSYTLNGTATAGTAFQSNTYSKTFKAGSYIFGSSANLPNGFYYSLVEGGTYYFYTHSNSYTSIYTFDENTTISAFREYMWVASGTTFDNFVLKPQIEKGTKANSYTPYGTTPIELCKIGTYQDYIYKDNGSWYLHKEIGKVVLDGSETYSTQTLYYVITFSQITPRPMNSSQLISNYFENTKEYGNGGIWAGSGGIAFNKNGLPSTITDTTTFKSWLSTHNTIVYYVLATPTNTLIEDTTLIEQLEALKLATSYATQTNISQTNNDAPFILDLSALELGSDHLVINNQGNIYSKPTLDLEGSGIVDIYLNDNQILEADLTEAGEIVIDTEAMEATNPSTGLLANRQVTGDYSRIKLDPGENDLRFSGDLTKATITNYERWL